MIGFIFICIIVIITSIGYAFYRFCKYINEIFLPYRKIIKNKVEFEGVIINIDERYTMYPKMRVIRHPVVEFQKGSRKYKIISLFSISFFEDEIEIGKKVTIVANNLNPSEAFIKNTIGADLAMFEFYVITIFHLAFTILLIYGWFYFIKIY